MPIAFLEPVVLIDIRAIQPNPRRPGVYLSISKDDVLGLERNTALRMVPGNKSFQLHIMQFQYAISIKGTKTLSTVAQFLFQSSCNKCSNFYSLPSIAFLRPVDSN
jgi:hypothetical protein